MSSFTYFTMDTGFRTLDSGKKAVTFLSFHYLFITLMQYERLWERSSPLGQAAKFMKIHLKVRNVWKMSSGPVLWPWVWHPWFKHSVVKTWNISLPAQRRINNIHKTKRKKSVLTKLVFQIFFRDFILKYQSVLENLDKDIINQSSQKPPCCGFQSNSATCLY